MRTTIALLTLLVLMRPSPATAQDLVTDISRHLVSIESNFTGAELLLFGAVEGGTPGPQIDVAIVVRGPSDDVTVWRKARVGGIWVNYESAEIQDVPGYYAVVSTRPLDEIAAAPVLARHGIGIDHLPLNAVVNDRADSDIAPFRRAILRLNQNRELFQEDSGGVVFLGDTLFRATVEMPANVPDGVFSASVYLFEDGNLIQAQTTPLYVSKAGFERFVFDLATHQPLLYGVLAVIIAVFAGWAASVIFRRR